MQLVQKKFYANCVLAHVSTWEREIICMWMLSPTDSRGNNYQPLMFISCCLFVSNTIYSEDGPNDICSLTCEISWCLTLSFEVLSIFYVHTCSLLLMSSESLFLELISGEMFPWIVAEALFRLPQSSKFFHSLSITSIFGRMHGALNVGKKSN